MFRSINHLNTYSPTNQFLWISLAFQAGIVNSGGFLGCHRFVSHVTGFATHFGVDVADGKYQDALGILSVPFFFVLGSMISAYFIDHRIAHKKNPNYLIVFALIFSLLLAVCILGIKGQFGEFGSPLVLESSYAFLAALCLICGLQNAMVTSASGASIRTTHLTGISTDLGVGIIRALAHTNSDEVRKKEVQATWLRIGLIGGFVLGSTLGAFLFLHYGYFGFVLPSAVAFAFVILGLKRFLQEVSHG